MTVPPLVVAFDPTARSSVSPVTVAPAFFGSPCGAALACWPAAGVAGRAGAGIEADASEAAPVVRPTAIRAAVAAAMNRGRMARRLGGLVGGPPAYCVGMSAAPSLHWAGKA